MAISPQLLGESTCELPTRYVALRGRKFNALFCGYCRREVGNWQLINSSTDTTLALPRTTLALILEHGISADFNTVQGSNKCAWSFANC
jgi:hypothetical protein